MYRDNSEKHQWELTLSPEETRVWGYVFVVCWDRLGVQKWMLTFFLSTLLLSLSHSKWEKLYILALSRNLFDSLRKDVFESIIVVRSIPVASITEKLLPVSMIILGNNFDGEMQFKWKFWRNEAECVFAVMTHGRCKKMPKIVSGVLRRFS